MPLALCEREDDGGGPGGGPGRGIPGYQLPCLDDGLDNGTSWGWEPCDETAPADAALRAAGGPGTGTTPECRMGPWTYVVPDGGEAIDSGP